MKFLSLLVGLVIVLVTLAIVGNQFLVLHKAHSSFEDYYIFRDCRQLVTKTDDYGICKIDSGQVIKIVKFKNKWYLDGDLPWGCLGNFCLGL